MAGARHKLSPFSVLLVMAVMMVAGAAVIPLLNVQYTPPRTASSISVRFSWPGASARLVEQEATSVIEGGLSMVDGLNGVYSTSRKGGGEVVVEFKKGARMDVARFEVASRLRYIYPSLPQEVSYPVLSLSASGRNEQAILGYTINSSLPPKRIEKYITANVMSALSRLPGVNRVELSGVAPFEYEISFDPDRADRYGISSSEIARAVTDWFGGDATGSVGTGEGNMLLLKIAGPREARFEAIPVGKSGDRIIYLGDLAKVRYHETAPTSYYRINGLNTVNISIWAERSSNIIGVAKEVREKMAGLSGNFPDGTSSLIGYDASEYVVGELNKIYTRTLLTLAILLLFVFVVSRSLRYLAVIVATLAANILVAFIFYYLFRLDIHIYSLAGITVSLGIIIDSSIIMTDHYGRHGDRRVFPAILGALLTTVASLSVIFFLPEEQRENLSDFALVVMINLIVSLLVSLMFIPSLLDKLPVGRRVSVRRYRRMRRTVRFNRIYMRFILWGRRRRWIFILLIVLGFGLPLHLLPPEIKQKDADNPNRWRSLYNKTVGGEFYQNNKQIFEKGLGGAFRLFRSATGSSGYYREPERQRLTIRAGMPEGCTVGQLNDVVGHMENFLNGFPEIEIFRTSIRSYDDATIEVSFKPEYENTGFPLSLKQQVIQAAINYGGATWGVYGIDENGFNNNVGTSYKSNRIILTGYNYDRLLRYAQELADTLSLNRRVSEAGVYAEVYWSVPQNEYYVALDRERIVRSGIDANLYFGNLRQLLFNTPLRSIFVDGKQERVSLVSSAGESFDLWNVRNNPLCIGEKEVKLSDFATIT
ncbi:MAG: efflux RND transporter permease subunit, partial [Rikenellaceae bacterium]|nr:efflux RND transporter permease subunit [Rikenellaceae bacterium]